MTWVSRIHALFVFTLPGAPRGLGHGKRVNSAPCTLTVNSAGFCGVGQEHLDKLFNQV